MLEYSFGRSIGSKFNIDKSVRHFPGNTIVCILDHSSEVYKRLRAIQDEIVSGPMGEFITLLPGDSLHMTAIEGVCDQVRDEGHWTSRFPLDAPLEEIDDFFEETWKTVPKLEGVRMCFDSFWVGNGIAIGLYPASYADDKRIRDWRDLVSEKTGLHFPGHDRYRFHIGLGYGITPPSEEAKAQLQAIADRFDREAVEKRFEFEVPSPSMTYFDDMFFFDTKRIPR